MKYFPVAYLLTFLAGLFVAGCTSAENTLGVAATPAAPAGTVTAIPAGIPPQAQAQIEKRRREKMGQPDSGGRQ